MGFLTSTLMLYNRIPKTGSETLRSLINKLAPINGFLTMGAMAAMTSLTRPQERAAARRMAKSKANPVRPKVRID